MSRNFLINESSSKNNKINPYGLKRTKTNIFDYIKPKKYNNYKLIIPDDQMNVFLNNHP
jgi:hypothetical protein